MGRQIDVSQFVIGGIGGPVTVNLPQNCKSRTVVDQFRKDITINKRAGPLTVIGGGRFRGDNFLKRFAFFL
jgi:hypothetical protein